MCEILINSHIYFTNLLSQVDSFLNGVKGKLLKCEGKILVLSPIFSVHNCSNRMLLGRQCAVLLALL